MFLQEGESNNLVREDKMRFLIQDVRIVLTRDDAMCVRMREVKKYSYERG